MNLENDQQLANTQHKLSLLLQWIAESESDDMSPEEAESQRSLVQMANQLREEIVRYNATKQRRAS